MRRNRTKPDWAAKQAGEIFTMFFEAESVEAAEQVEHQVANMLRNAERRGRREEKGRQVLVASQPTLTARTMRRYKKQLEARMYDDFEGLTDKFKREAQTTCMHGVPARGYCPICVI